ncbi:hypothetical protein Vpro01_01957 [Vibrio proteolyticus]
MGLRPYILITFRRLLVLTFSIFKQRIPPPNVKLKKTPIRPHIKQNFFSHRLVLFLKNTHLRRVI